MASFASGDEAGGEMMQNEPVDSDLVAKAKAAKKLTQEPWATVLGTTIEAFPKWFGERKQFGLWGRDSKDGTGKKSLGRFPDGKFDFGPNSDKADGTSWMTLETASRFQTGTVRGGVTLVGLTFFGTTFIDHDGETWHDCVIDLDAVRDPETGAWTPFARDAIEGAQRLGGWSEISPSKTGAKIFGKVPAVGGSQKLAFDLPDGSAIEVFVGRKAHLCLTGVPWDPSAKVGDSLPDLSKVVAMLQAAAVVKPGASNAQTAKGVPQGGGGGDFQGRSVPKWFNDEVDLWGLMTGDGWTMGKPSPKGGWLVTRPAKDLGKGCSGVLTGDGLRLINWSSSRDAVVSTDKQGYDSFAYWCQKQGWDCADSQVLKTVEGWLKTGPIGSPPTVLDTVCNSETKNTGGFGGALPSWTRPAGKPFPTDCLGPEMAGVVRALSKAMKFSENYIGPLVLSFLCGSIGMTRQVRLMNTWLRFPVLWSVFVGDSGSGKSPPLNALKTPFAAANAREFARYEEEFARHGVDMADYEKRKKGASKASQAFTELPPMAPCLALPMLGDTTFDALTSSLLQNPRGTMVVEDEMDNWFQMFTRFSNNGNSDRGRWLPLYDGGQIVFNRIVRGAGVIPRGGVSICGGIQPGILAKALDAGALNSGLASRLILVEVPEELRIHDFKDIDQTFLDAWDKQIKANLGLQFDLDRSAGTPVILDLDDDSKELYLKYLNTKEGEKFEASGMAKADLAKLMDLPLRIGLGRCVSARAFRSNETNCPIEAEYMEQALTLTDWIEQGRARALNKTGILLETDKNPPLAKTILAAIRESSLGLLKTEISAIFNRNKPKEQIDAALAWLMTQNLVRKEIVPPKGGPPSERFLVV